MEPKTLAAIAVFTAITVALVLSPFKIPAPYAPFLIYQIWEIPIVVAFLLYGPVVGVSTSILNTIVLLAVYPGDLPTGPIYNLAAVLSMLLGIYIVHLFVHGLSGTRRETMVTASSTVLGMIIRTGVELVVTWIFLPLPYPLGFGLPVEAVIVTLPIVALFNATVVLYTIPIGYFLAKAVSLGTTTSLWITKRLKT